jgi:hypothetical protein
VKLGIIVVYLVSERNEPLLDLHFRQIEKNTTTPYTIYGSANRLLPQIRRKLEQRSDVKICDCVSTDLRSGAEHAFYLDQLVRFAAEDGATHIASFHVDSFPIRPGWAEELVTKLSGECMLTAMMRGMHYGHVDRKPLAACMFFSRDFYLNYQPGFSVSELDMATPEYQRYLKEWDHIVETGVGYGFKIFTAGLAWYPLEKSNKVNDYPAFGNIYGDLIFHLGESVWRPDFGGASNLSTSSSRPSLAFFLRKASDALKPILPMQVKRLFGTQVQTQIVTPMYEYVRQQLLDDPESYLNYLRTGEARKVR